MSASWGNASSGRVLELVDVDGDGLAFHELPLGAGRDGHYPPGSVHVHATMHAGGELRDAEVVIGPDQAAELREWLHFGRGVSPWDLVFPGADAAQTRAARLGLFRLLEPVGERDPCRADPVALLARDLSVTRGGARRVLELLRSCGWIDAGGRVVAMVRR